MTTLSLERAGVGAPRATRANDDIEDDAAALVATGWAAKPKGHGVTAEEQSIANALLRDWSEAPKPQVETYEWSWVTNSLGRRWQVVQLVDGRRFLSNRGFTNDGLHRYVKALRAKGHTVIEAGAASRSAAA